MMLYGYIGILNLKLIYHKPALEKMILSFGGSLYTYKNGR